jgi:hypothetical protein
MSVPKKMPCRAVIYAKDIENITGRRDRGARKILQNIREKFGKEKMGFVTIKEFCLYTGLEEELVKEFLMY